MTKKNTIQPRVIQKFLEGLSERVIASHLCISKSYVHKIIQQAKRKNKSTKRTITGRPRILKNNDIKYLKALLKERVDWYLYELCEEMKLWLGHEISLSTIWRYLHRLGYTHKKVDNNMIILYSFI